VVDDILGLIVLAIVSGVRARLQLAEAEFTLAITPLFGLGLLAVYAGVAAIIGAFLAGMALSETVEAACGP
jgi:Kef-type K+ transport system membrane component KefB